MAISQNHIINIQPGVSAPLVIHCSQGDTGTQINLTVVNGDETFDCSSYICSVHGVRSDGGNWGPITCTVSGSTVCFSLTSAMTAIAGACLAEITIGTVGTANFAILVENATFSLGVTYTEDVSLYQSILNYIMGATQNIKTEATATVNKALDQMNTKANDLQNQYAVTNAKLDAAISAATQDSEVQDIRVKADGTSATTAGNAVREQITGLKSAFDNALSMPPAGHSIIQGSYNSSGNVAANPARIRVSGFIEVKKGEIIKFTTGTNTTGMLVALFNTDKVYQSETWHADGASVEILSDGYVILVFRKDTNNTAITPEEYDATTQITPVIWGEIGKNSGNFADFKGEISVPVASANLLNPSITVINGYINPNGGVYSDNSKFRLLDYVAVEGGKYLISSVAGAYKTARFIAEYDANKKIINATSSSIEGEGNGTHYTSAYLLLKSNTRYVRISYVAASLDLSSIMLSLSDNYDLPNFEHYIQPYLSASSSFLKDYNVRTKINIYADGIEQFYNKMVNAFQAKNCDVYIHKGDYIYTNALVDSIRAQGKRGVPIGNGCRYYFDTGARLICEYTGDNTADVALLFSALDSQNIGSDYEIYNLDLTAKNILYGIHDECDGSSNFCTHKYKNCYVTLDNTALGSASDYKSRCIGGGLGKYEEIIIEDCVFLCTNPGKQTTAEQPVAYHGANKSTFSDAKFVVTGCYFNGLFRATNLSGNTQAPYPKIIYSNNSHVGNPSIDATWAKYVFNNSTN